MVVQVHLRCIPYLVVKVALSFGKKNAKTVELVAAVGTKYSSYTNLY